MPSDSARRRPGRLAQNQEQTPTELLLRDPALSPGGNQVVFATASALCVLNLQQPSGPDSAGRDCFAPSLNTLPPEQFIVLRRGRFSRPVWSPDGGWIAVEEHEDEPDADTGARCHVGLLRADGSEYRRISPQPGRSGSPAWLSPRALLFVHADRPVSPSPGEDRYRCDDALLVYELAAARLWPRRTRVPVATYDRLEWLPVPRMLAFCPLVAGASGPDQPPETPPPMRGDRPSHVAIHPTKIVRWPRGAGSAGVAPGAESRAVPPLAGCVRPAPDGLHAVTSSLPNAAADQASAAAMPILACAVRPDRVFALESQRELASIEHARMPSWSADGKQLIFVSTKPRETHGEAIVLADADDLSRYRQICWTATDPAEDHPRFPQGNLWRRIWWKLAAACHRLLPRTALQPQRAETAESKFYEPRK